MQTTAFLYRHLWVNVFSLKNVAAEMTKSKKKKKKALMHYTTELIEIKVCDTVKRVILHIFIDISYFLYSTVLKAIYLSTYPCFMALTFPLTDP